MIDFAKHAKRAKDKRMSIDFLNSICGNVKASEAPDFKPHPLGEFHGTVLSVESKVIKQANNSVIELKIATTDGAGAKVGVANYNEWMFTTEDITQAQTSQEGRDRLNARIGRIKRLFVDLGVYDHQKVDTMVWSSQGNMNDPGILESFDFLKGKTCSVTVKANTKPNKPAMIFVNAPLETVVGVTGAAPEVRKQQAPMGMQPPMGQPPMGQPQQQYNAPVGQPPMGQPQGAPPMHPQQQFGAPPTQNLNGIPF